MLHLLLQGITEKYGSMKKRTKNIHTINPKSWNPQRTDLLSASIVHELVRWMLDAMHSLYGKRV